MEISRYIMAIFYILAGVNHFISPKFYYKITPPFLKNKPLINQLSGGAEILLGLALFTPWYPWAAWGVILLLIAVFPANVYHLQQKGAGMKIPLWALWVRLPLQGALIYWAYLYTVAYA